MGPAPLAIGLVFGTLLSGQLIFKGVNCNGTIECGAIQLQFGNPFGQLQF